MKRQHSPQSSHQQFDLHTLNFPCHGTSPSGKDRRCLALCPLNPYHSEQGGVVHCSASQIGVTTRDGAQKARSIPEQSKHTMTAYD